MINRRMALRSRNGAGAAGVAFAVVLMFGGCATDSPGSAGGSGNPSPGGSLGEQVSVAEVFESGADCTLTAVVDGLQGIEPAPDPTASAPGASPAASPSNSPAPGTVPAGFVPVKVVECRIMVSDDGNGDTTPAIHVEQVTRTGDLGPLLTELNRPSTTAVDASNQVCPLMLEIKPQIFLVDANGLAIRPAWPHDECGFLFPTARPTLDRLTIESTEQVQ